jgi:hypothetical protein
LSEVGSELQEAYVEAFDAEREAIGPDGNLEILKRSVAPVTTPYTVAATISSGWKGKRVTEHATGQEFFEVKMVETSEDLTALFRDRVSYLKIDQYYYKFSGVQEPRRATDVWVVRCSPTGERKPT